MLLPRQLLERELFCLLQQPAVARQQLIKELAHPTNSQKQIVNHKSVAGIHLLDNLWLRRILVVKRLHQLLVVLPLKAVTRLNDVLDLVYTERSEQGQIFQNETVDVCVVLT